MGSTDGLAGYKSGFFQHLDMFGYCVERHIVPVSQVCDSTGPLLTELRQKRAACRIAHSFEYFRQNFVVYIFNHRVDYNPESPFVNQKVEYSYLRKPGTKGFRKTNVGFICIVIWRRPGPPGPILPAAA